MSSVLDNLQKSLGDLFSALRVQLCAALSVAPDSGRQGEESDAGIDPDFEGWLHGDPSVTKNPASRYGDRTPGYITGNGLGSMEIGAADEAILSNSDIANNPTTNRNRKILRSKVNPSGKKEYWF